MKYKITSCENDEELRSLKAEIDATVFFGRTVISVTYDSLHNRFVVVSLVQKAEDEE